MSMGKLPGAGDVHVGFVDNSGFLGGEAGLLGFTDENTVSYASPSIGGFSFQVDAQGDRSASDDDVDSAQFGATMQIGENAKIGVAYVDRATKGADNPVAKRAAGLYYSEDGPVTGNATNATRAQKAGAKCADTKKACAGSLAVAADPEAHMDDDKTAMIAAHYAIGGLGFHVGYGQRKWDTDKVAATWNTAGEATSVWLKPGDEA